MTDFERISRLVVPLESSKQRAETAFMKFADTTDKLRAAARQTAPNPTEGQKESGNYKKGRLRWNGLTLVIETAAGKKRKPEWPALKDHYGYVAGTESQADGDAVDVFISEKHPDSELLFVVNQKKKDGTFDEHKVVIGEITLEGAKKTYLQNYSKGWTGMGEVTPITVDHFKWWLEHADTSKEVKNGYFAARDNLKKEKRGSANPTSGGKDFWEENNKRKEEAQAPGTMQHIKDGYIPCKCGERYHVMPDDETCPKCGGPLRTRLRSMKRPLSKSGFENYAPQMWLVKRAADDEDDRPFTICVDLDGTLAEKEEPFSTKTIGEPRQRALDYVRLFHENGARIIIFTVRGTDELVKGWLDKHDVPHDFVNENPDQPKDSSGKILADVYWDDRGFNAEDPDEHGPEILRRLLGHSNKQDDKEEKHQDGGLITISRHTVITISGPSLLEATEETNEKADQEQQPGDGDSEDDGETRRD